MSEADPRPSKEKGAVDEWAVDEWMEQFGALLTEHAADSREVREYYEAHAQHPEFKELADTLLELKAQYDAEETAAPAARSLVPLAVAASVCIPLILLAVMVYFSGSQQRQVSELAALVNTGNPLRESVSAWQKQIESQNEQIGQLVTMVERQDSRFDALAEWWPQESSPGIGLKDLLEELVLMRRVPLVNGSQWLDHPREVEPTPTLSPKRSYIHFVSRSVDRSEQTFPFDMDHAPPTREKFDDDRFVNLGPDDEAGERFYIYEDEDWPSEFVPGGWLPDGMGISQNTQETDDPHRGQYHIRVGCQLSAKAFGGIHFLLDGKWEPPQPFDLLQQLGAKQGDRIKCRFWARAKTPVSAQFRVGGVGMGEVRDSLVFPVATRWIELTPQWKMYEIDLTGEDVSSLVNGFAWVCDRIHNGEKDVEFDLDTIYFVKTPIKTKVPEAADIGT